MGLMDEGVDGWVMVKWEKKREYAESYMEFKRINCTVSRWYLSSAFDLFKQCLTLGLK